MEYQNIEFSVVGAIAYATLNRPDQLNPLDGDTLTELNHCFDLFERNPEAEILVLRGKGRAFSAGGDLKRHLALHQDTAFMHELAGRSVALLERIERCEKLVVLVVTGLCVAGGLELALCCDVVIASEEASFSDGHLNFSVLPGAGGTQRLPRAVGILRAKEIMLSARFVSGAEAARIGLASFCWSATELEEKLTQFLDGLLSKSFSSRAAIKYLSNQAMRMPLDAGLHFERSYVLNYEITHPDAHEGLKAFVEKRKPKYKSGRAR